MFVRNVGMKFKFKDFQLTPAQAVNLKLHNKLEEKLCKRCKKPMLCFPNLKGGPPIHCNNCYTEREGERAGPWEISIINLDSTYKEDL